MGIEFIVVWILCAALAEGIAMSKGRSGCMWTIVGGLLGPLGVIAAAAMPVKQDVLDERAVRRGILRRCPFCAEAIKKEAVICPHCRGESAAPEENKTWLDRFLGL